MQNWPAMEQQVRDRVAQARTAARIRTLTQEFAPTTRRRDSVGITILRLANWVWLLECSGLPHLTFHLEALTCDTN